MTSSFFFAFQTSLHMKGGERSMLFNIGVALIAYYLGKSNMSLDDFFEMLKKLLKLENGG